MNNILAKKIGLAPEDKPLFKPASAQNWYQNKIRQKLGLPLLRVKLNSLTGKIIIS